MFRVRAPHHLPCILLPRPQSAPLLAANQHKMVLTLRIPGRARHNADSLRLQLHLDHIGNAPAGLHHSLRRRHVSSLSEVAVQQTTPDCNWGVRLRPVTQYLQ